ncbi:MAG: PQQ-dependent sugar dehydrogenase [Acidobacteriota bacterium]
MTKSILMLSCIAVGSVAAGQQSVPFANGIPVAPKGLAGKPLPMKPVVYDTGEGERIRVVVQNRGLEHPYGAVFIPNGPMLVIERPGRLRAIRNGVLDPKPIAGAPKAFSAGEPGLPGAVHGYMDIALHPDFAKNQLIYLVYTKPVNDKTNHTAVARGKWDGKGLVDVKDIYTLEFGSTSRIVFGKDGLLYLSTTGNDPQDLGTLGGKILRLRDDGTVPPDNPFAKRAGAKPEIFTYGHRNTLGLALHPKTGEIWQNENGPNGGDEINILKAGANYGWPLVSLGRAYPGNWQGKDGPNHLGYEAPVVYWTPAIAISGMLFYTGDKFPKWKGDIFVGSLRTGEIPGTGHVERILFNEKMEELRREALLTDLRQRIRDVKQGPDGLIYVLTDEPKGAVLRIEPAK